MREAQLNNTLRPFSVAGGVVPVKNDSSIPITLRVEIRGERPFTMVLDPGNTVQVPKTGLIRIVALRYGDLAGIMARPIEIDSVELQVNTTVVFRTTALILHYQIVAESTERVFPAIHYTSIEIIKKIVSTVLFLYIAFWFSGLFGMLLKVVSVLHTLRRISAARSEPDPSDAFPRVVSARERVFRSNAMSPRHVLRLPQSVTPVDLDGSLLFHLAQWDPKQFNDASMKKYAYRVCDAMIQAYKVLGGSMNIDVAILDPNAIRGPSQQYVFKQETGIRPYARNNKGNRDDAMRRKQQLRRCAEKTKTLSQELQALCDRIQEITQ